MIKGEQFICEFCETKIEVVNPGEGKLICCGELMKRVIDEEIEKRHIPKINIDFGKAKVSLDHPMEEDHYISKIELLSEGKVLNFVELSPGDEPGTTFKTENLSIGQLNSLKARITCNKHGTWDSR
jgi:superoxide reductase